ncbi:MAG: DUF58 domain-containing protein [Labilithrix sp.]|nr:DUF58 domain-containing protein [Labilithrix sp.]
MTLAIEPIARPPRADDDASLLSPEIAGRLGRLAIVARKAATARSRGRRRARRVGGGTETIDLRAYGAGDDPRRIAWHAYARLERLLVRLVADEAPLRLTLVVDQSASMSYGRPAKIRQAARIAAGFAAVALGGEDRVALAVGSGGDARTARPVSGRAGLPRLLAMLDGIAAVGGTDLTAAVRTALDAAPGRGVAVIISDLFEPQGILAGAREARRRGHEVAIVEVLAPFELDPPDLSGFDLEDEETGELVELPEHGARERFQEMLAMHRWQIDEAARSLEAVVVRTTTDEPFETIVTRALGAGLLGGGAR